MRAHSSKSLRQGGADAEVPAEPPPLVLMFAWCARCARQARMLTARQAADRAGVSTSTIYRWAGSGRVHTAATQQGSLVCAESLYPGES